jgi:Txe/YoeB family toxin of Txe-Axe toxin-antitoxin module
MWPPRIWKKKVKKKMKETQNKICKKNCKNCQKDFTIEPDDFGFYEKIGVPPPTFCPECRSQRRYAWRNNISLYNRKCDLCKKGVITIYSKESGIIVYCNKCWWSDQWDPKSYGQDYDFSRPFFEQWKELSLKVPHMALINDNNIASVNCEYTQDFAFGKNCYMVFVAWYIENVLYSYFILKGKNIMDTMINMAEAEYLYECINCSHGYMVKYSEYSRACINSQFLYDCQNCSDCFMCAGIRNKKFFFRNQQYSKEEYEKILKSYRLDTFSGVEKAQKEHDEFILSYSRRYVWLKQNINCSGDVVSYSKNVKNSFITKKSENCAYCDLLADGKDCYDLSGSGELSECYESIVCDQSNRNLFGIYSWKNQDVFYTEHCHSSKSLFGCAGLRSAKHCIFNKQYTKEEYEKLVPKIIEQMNKMPYIDDIGNSYAFGEFYPAELSPFGYNETEANEHFPLTKNEAVKKGYNWQDNIQKTTGKETLKPEDIPESINEVGEKILNEILACVNCKRNYKIVPNELIFYRKMKIPIPRRCFYCRHEARLKRRNPFKLWPRTCMCDKQNHLHGKNKCEVEFETSYAPERPEIIYCEKCYQQEVY